LFILAYKANLCTCNFVEAEFKDDIIKSNEPGPGDGYSALSPSVK